MIDALEWVTAALVARAGAPDLPRILQSVLPSALVFLIRRYPADGRPELRDALERGLAAGLVAFDDERDPRTRCEWLGALAAASAMVDDAQLAETVERALPDVIDGLEQFVRNVYEPGEGAMGASCHEQLRLASALLAAFDLTGRLPYSMLAEELLQTATRRWWDTGAGAFRAEFGANCIAVQLCCRLAMLHRDVDYASRAVVAPAARYDEQAALALVSLESHYREHNASAADYGLALLDWFSLSALPN